MAQCGHAAPPPVVARSLGRADTQIPMLQRELDAHARDVALVVPLEMQRHNGAKAHKDELAACVALKAHAAAADVIKVEALRHQTRTQHF